LRIHSKVPGITLPAWNKRAGVYYLIGRGDRQPKEKLSYSGALMRLRLDWRFDGNRPGEAGGEGVSGATTGGSARRLPARGRREVRDVRISGRRSQSTETAGMFLRLWYGVWSQGFPGRLPVVSPT